MDCCCRRSVSNSTHFLRWFDSFFFPVFHFIEFRFGRSNVRTSFRLDSLVCFLFDCCLNCAGNSNFFVNLLVSVVFVDRFVRGQRLAKCSFLMFGNRVNEMVVNRPNVWLQHTSIIREIQKHDCAANWRQNLSMTSSTTTKNSSDCQCPINDRRWRTREKVKEANVIGTKACCFADDECSGDHDATEILYFETDLSRIWSVLPCVILMRVCVQSNKVTEWQETNVLKRKKCHGKCEAMTNKWPTTAN